MTQARGRAGAASSRARAPRVAVLCDLREEDWFSMNLVAEMLVENLAREHAGALSFSRICPPMRRRLTRTRATRGRLFNAERLLNRFWDYPRHVKETRGEFDLFHVVDHSYAQLVHALPCARTIVTCHDIDTFRCLVEPEREPRSAAFKLMARRTLTGLRKAARVACDSVATRDELLAYKLLPAERLRVIPNGVHPIFTHAGDARADRAVEELLGAQDASAPELLHVGSTIARKRIDVLLRVFAEVRRAYPRARLIRAGGEFTTAQHALVEKLGLSGSIVVLRNLSAEVLAAVYRRAALLLLPSEREGFGLPLVEAERCGTPVLASELPVLREVGAGRGATTFCPVGQTEAWAAEAVRLLGEREADDERWAARREAAIRHASKFTWQEYVRRTVELYMEVWRA